MLKTYIVATSAFDETRALSKKIARWAHIDSESGVTALEYGMIAALIAVVIAAAVSALGTSVNGTFTAIKTGLSGG